MPSAPARRQFGRCFAKGISKARSGPGARVTCGSRAGRGSTTFFPSTGASTDIAGDGRRTTNSWSRSPKPSRSTVPSRRQRSASRPLVKRPSSRSRNRSRRHRNRSSSVPVAARRPSWSHWGCPSSVPTLPHGSSRKLSGSASWASLPSSTASWQRGSSCMSSSRARLRSLSRRTWRSPAGRVTPSGRARPPLPLWRCLSSLRVCSPSPRTRTGRRTCCGGTGRPSASSIRFTVRTSATSSSRSRSSSSPRAGCSRSARCDRLRGHCV